MKLNGDFTIAHEFLHRLVVKLVLCLSYSWLLLYTIYSRYIRSRLARPWVLGGVCLPHWGWSSRTRPVRWVWLLETSILWECRALRMACVGVGGPSSGMLLAGANVSPRMRLNTSLEL